MGFVTGTSQLNVLVVLLSSYSYRLMKSLDFIFDGHLRCPFAPPPHPLRYLAEPTDLHIFRNERTKPLHRSTKKSQRRLFRTSMTINQSAYDHVAAPPTPVITFSKADPMMEASSSPSHLSRRRGKAAVLHSAVAGTSHV
ncbi:hypothetical protein F511_01584 [Dorcoceras hygrometricum]|nr:hypothetical protein F511_01584 [Dorcoceras hygrometricum]